MERAERNGGALAGLVAGPAVAVAMLLAGPLSLPELEAAAWATAALTAWMAIWWVSEAVPLPVTALLPLPLLPMVGVADIGAAAAPYASPLVFLFLGGFLLAAAVQQWSLHRRLALAVATMGLSHVTSNTATAAIVLPLAFATAGSFDTAPVMLGATVAMAASCAFMLPVATPPNAIVFASGQLRVIDMVRAGAVMSAIAIGVIVVAAWLLVPLVLG